MTDDGKTPSGGDGKGSGGDGDRNPPKDGNKDGGTGDGGGGGKPGDTVAYDTHQRLLREKKKEREENDRLRREIAERDQKDQEQKEQQLKDDNKWKEYAEEQEKKRKAAEEQLQQRDKDRDDARKIHAALDYIKGNVPNEYWHLIDIDKIKTHPETGDIDESSVKEAAESFRQRHHRLIDPPGGTNRGGNNGGTGDNFNRAPDGGGDPLSLAEWKKLPLKEKKARMAEMHQANFGKK